MDQLMMQMIFEFGWEEEVAGRKKGSIPIGEEDG